MPGACGCCGCGGCSGCAGTAPGCGCAAFGALGPVGAIGISRRYGNPVFSEADLTPEQREKLEKAKEEVKKFNNKNVLYKGWDIKLGVTTYEPRLVYIASKEGQGKKFFDLKLKGIENKIDMVEKGGISKILEDVLPERFGDLDIIQ